MSSIGVERRVYCGMDDSSDVGRGRGKASTHRHHPSRRFSHETMHPISTVGKWSYDRSNDRRAIASRRDRGYRQAAMTADPIEPIDLANDPSTRRPRTAFGWFWTFARSGSPYYRPSDRSAAHPKPWPAGFDPVKNPVFSQNVLEIPALPTAVFGALCAATEWPTFYPNAADVVIEGGSEQRLRAGARFTWR